MYTGTFERQLGRGQLQAVTASTAPALLCLQQVIVIFADTENASQRCESLINRSLRVTIELNKLMRPVRSGAAFVSLCLSLCVHFQLFYIEYCKTVETNRETHKSEYIRVYQTQKSQKL